MGIYFEDLEIGEIERFGHYVVTRDEVIEFASKYDPQAFHLDDEAAAKGLFGKLAASGWHTAGMAMRMMIDHWKETGRIESSLGGGSVEELHWLRPVFPGDILSCELELLHKRTSKRRPDLGIIYSRCTVSDKKKVEQVMTMKFSGFVKCRGSDT